MTKSIKKSPTKSVKKSVRSSKSKLESALSINPFDKAGLLAPKFERDLLRKFSSKDEDYFLSRGGTKKRNTRKNNKSRKSRK